MVKKFPQIRKLLFDRNGKLHPYINILVNGENVYPDQLTKPVADGAELSMLYIISGGVSLKIRTIGGGLEKFQLLYLR